MIAYSQFSNSLHPAPLPSHPFGNSCGLYKLSFPLPLSCRTIFFPLQYARQELLDFMFRHGHYNDACLLFFSPDGVPPPPQPSSVGTVTSSSSPQRPDPLVTDYGTIDSLCELCIGYGAMSVLEEVIFVRISSSASLDDAVNKYTEAALTKICNYCETHKHFNYLYKFLVMRLP